MSSVGFDFGFTPSRGPARAEAMRQGLEAVTISNAGFYVAPSGRRVDIATGVGNAVASTRDWLPDTIVAAPAAGGRGARTRIAVVNGTSLATARAMATREPAHPQLRLSKESRRRLPARGPCSRRVARTSLCALPVPARQRHVCTPPWGGRLHVLGLDDSLAVGSRVSR
jgi:hypothetical protein